MLTTVWEEYIWNFLQGIQLNLSIPDPCHELQYFILLLVLPITYYTIFLVRLWMTGREKRDHSICLAVISRIRSQTQTTINFWTRNMSQKSVVLAIFRIIYCHIVYNEREMSENKNRVIYGRFGSRFGH